ncbi:hypothetical protein BC829DRAFT_359316 [Chytridium lagenaria]|nr:hypothetical protein BC829DRAFT_359316 [Chytridium lagenaria]
MAIAKLQKDLETAKAETDRMQNMWLEAQKENLKSKDDIAKLTSDNLFLKTQLGITETIRGKTVEEVESARKETFEQKMESSKLYAELRKLQPLIEEYRQKIITLEQHLTESRLQLEETHVNSLNATNMLKTEIRRLYEDRKEVRRTRMLDEKSNQGLERKYMLAKEMVEKLKAERHELQRTAFELKVRADEMEKKYFDAQIMAKRMAEQAGRTVGEITTRLALRSLRFLSIIFSLKNVQTKGASLASEKSSSKSAVSDVSQELPGRFVSRPSTINLILDFHSWKLKIESLTCERAFLVNENSMLKTKVEDLLVKIAKSERNLSQTQQRLKNFDKDLKNAQNYNKMMSSRYQRAERVAASIERQFKEARPNTRIDYSLMTEAEPSTQLLAALMLKVRPSLCCINSLCIYTTGFPQDSDMMDAPPPSMPAPLPTLPEKNSTASFSGFSRRCKYFFIWYLCQLFR